MSVALDITRDSMIGVERCAAIGETPKILSEIYREDVNIAIWRRTLSSSEQDAYRELVTKNVSLSMSVKPKDVVRSLANSVDAITHPVVTRDIEQLVDMFCLLFDLPQAGLRLTALKKTMCPKFHIDRVPCRLVTSCYGVGTEWLPHAAVDRSKLGHGSNGLADHKSGLYRNDEDIHCLKPGDVALLKGELWDGNEGAGLVHRSPDVSTGQNRLLLTLDFIN